MAPSPTFISAWSDPWWLRMIEREIASPMPSPPGFVV
jgi:hypothetical protein